MRGAHGVSAAGPTPIGYDVQPPREAPADQMNLRVVLHERDPVSAQRQVADDHPHAPWAGPAGHAQPPCWDPQKLPAHHVTHQ